MLDYCCCKAIDVGQTLTRREKKNVFRSDVCRDVLEYLTSLRVHTNLMNNLPQKKSFHITIMMVPFTNTKTFV